MAQRRMFSKTIIDSARFLKMPVESQLLYFHLGLRADDDGVVEAYPILKILGTPEDALKVLVAKQLIRILNEDLVAYIVDWREHNTIRADRKVDSIYKNLLIQMVPDVELTLPQPRADTEKPTGRTMDNQRTAQVRLGKDSIGEDTKKEEDSAIAAVDVSYDMYQIWDINYKAPRQKGEPSLYQRVFDTFYYEYPRIANTNFIPRKKDCEFCKQIAELIGRMKDFSEQSKCFLEKASTLATIARAGNKFQSWTFTPGDMMKYWDKLYAGAERTDSRDRTRNPAIDSLMW